MVHPQMKVKDAELPFRMISMEDVTAVAAVDSAALLSVNLSVALSPILNTKLRVLVILIITTMTMRSFSIVILIGTRLK